MSYNANESLKEDDVPRVSNSVFGYTSPFAWYFFIKFINQTKLRGLSPRANYTAVFIPNSLEENLENL
jgi:hypothetical protein